MFVNYCTFVPGSNISYDYKGKQIVQSLLDSSETKTNYLPTSGTNFKSYFLFHEHPKKKNPLIDFFLAFFNIIDSHFSMV